MKKYVIGVANAFDNDLILEVIEAPSLKEATKKHSSFNAPSTADHYDEWFEELPEDLEALKQFFFDGDMTFGAIEL